MAYRLLTEQWLGWFGLDCVGGGVGVLISSRRTVRSQTGVNRTQNKKSTTTKLKTRK